MLICKEHLKQIVRDMKKLLLAAVFAFATATTFAQGSKTPAQSAPKTIEQRASDITTSMAKHLRLTPEQAKAIGKINLTSMKQAEKVREKYKKDPRRVVAEMDAIAQGRLSLIKDVLTPLQFTQYQQRREEKMGVPKEAQSAPGSNQQSPRSQEQYNN